MIIMIIMASSIALVSALKKALMALLQKTTRSKYDVNRVMYMIIQ